MLLEIAIGDAYGAGFEFVGKEFIYANNNLEYVTHPNISSANVDLLRMGEQVIHPREMHGRYTDDTQMSIAIAEVIVKGLPWTKEVLADSFVNSFKRDQRTGYAGGFYKFLCNVTNGVDFLEQMRPTSDKSGSAMRAASVGVFSTVEEVVEKCSLQASLTHNTADGIAAANAAALMVHYFIYDKGPKSQVGKFIKKCISGDWDKPWSGFVSVKGIECVRAAITAIVESETLSEVLKRCIRFSGDVDTVAAIAMGPASCCEQLEHDIPANLINGLENGPYGREYIIDLDKKLMALANNMKTRLTNI
ncbi:MAG TPA: ADP-ribosylglycohydrolase family protein [Sedimentisphaerales bacterium]|nr:ADP-ribosylglycohydrolase family protein [Sedimentisphaerales bacterium]